MEVFKINQTQLAKKLGVTHQYISLLKINGVNTHFAKKLELATGIPSIEWVLHKQFPERFPDSPWDKLNNLPYENINKLMED